MATNTLTTNEYPQASAPALKEFETVKPAFQATI